MAVAARGRQLRALIGGGFGRSVADGGVSKIARTCCRPGGLSRLASWTAARGRFGTLGVLFGRQVSFAGRIESGLTNVAVEEVAH